MSKKGSVVLSETMLETTAILISFILIVLVVQLVFSQQNQRTYESVFESLSRDISTSIDRASATAGNIQIQEDIPKGLKFKLSIDQKALIIEYGDKNSVRTFFSSDIKSGPYLYENPKSLCIIKSVNDNRVYISNKTCSCDPKDSECDPECNVEHKCDSKCVNDGITGTCNPFCAKQYSDVCDKNCYKGYQTGVCEKNCIRENERDGICSPDCAGVKKGVCDLDCYDQYSNGKTGNCDPDCPPKDKIFEENGIKYKSRDGNCYTGCINTTVSPVGKPISPLTQSCNTTNMKDYQCSDNVVWQCGAEPMVCAFGNVCTEPCEYTSLNLCCAQKNNPPMFNSTDSVCCCEYNGGTCELNTRGTCLIGGGYAYPADSSYCKQSSPKGISTNIRLTSDGICDLDCKDSKNICDPDCPDSEACKNVCSEENQPATDHPCCEGLFACPGDNICRKDCCGNGFCEGRPDSQNGYGWGPGNKTKWETFYTCPQDCKDDPKTKLSSCQSGPFTQSVCYSTVNDNQGRFIGFEPVWKNNIFSVCDSEIQKFLDRRNWDIKEVIQTWTSPTPEGWAWDNSRYEDACNKMQGAWQTVLANEKYTSEAYKCCGLVGASCDADTEYTPECSGVGFCIDHSTAVVSILRTLGVPAKNVYSTFTLAKSSAHAWVLFLCDENEPENRKPIECEGNWGKWLSIDATGHYIAPLNSNQYSTLCLMWNDQGLYAQTDGRINATAGFAYNSSIPRSSSADPLLCIYNKLCKPFGVDCVVP
jgi:hypothetical protein